MKLILKLQEVYVSGSLLDRIAIIYYRLRVKRKISYIIKIEVPSGFDVDVQYTNEELVSMLVCDS